MTFLELAFVAAISSLWFWYEDKSTSVQAAPDVVAKAETKRETQRGGGADPLLCDAMEFELLSRKVQLPSKLDNPTDPAAYHSELRLLLDKTAHLAPPYEATGPEKFTIAVPDSAREIGHVLMDMASFNRLKESPLPPQSCEQMDF